MMTFIYIIMFIALYIAFGITIFGIGYKYDFMNARKEYKQCQGDEYSTIVMSIIFWPLIAACFLLFSIPRRIIDDLINAIDEDIRYEELLRNKRLKKDKDNYNDNNNIKFYD